MRISVPFILAQASAMCCQWELDTRLMLMHANRKRKCKRKCLRKSVARQKCDNRSAITVAHRLALNLRISLHASSQFC
jgi:hypothetical protein